MRNEDVQQEGPEDKRVLPGREVCLFCLYLCARSHLQLSKYSNFFLKEIGSHYISQAGHILINSNYSPASALQGAGTINMGHCAQFHTNISKCFSWAGVGGAHATLSTSQLPCALINHFLSLLTVWPVPATQPPSLKHSSSTACPLSTTITPCA